MERSVVFPSQDVPIEAAIVKAFAQAAEDLGYSRLIVYDHVLGAVHEGRQPPLTAPYDETTPFHEPLTLLGFIAAVTSSIELATGVLVLPQRQTVLVAKQAVQVDRLSGGRLILGVGVGWNPVEYEALRVPFEDRGARLEEQVALLRELWRPGVVDFAGHFERVDRAAIVPSAARQIPLWMGGSSRAALRRAARISDGFLFAYGGAASAEQARELRDLVAREGRKAAEVPMELYVSYGIGPGEWAEERDLWEQLGGARMAVRTSVASARAIGQDVRLLETVDDHIAAIAEFARWWG